MCLSFICFCVCSCVFVSTRLRECEAWPLYGTPVPLSDREADLGGRVAQLSSVSLSIAHHSLTHTHTHSEGCPSPTSSHQPPPVHSSRQEWKGVVIWAVLPVSTIPNTHTRNVFTITNWNNPLSYMSISDSQETLQSDGTHRMRTSDTYWVKRTS